MWYKIYYERFNYILLAIILIFIICFIKFINKEFKSFQKEIEIYYKCDINNVTKINNEDKVVSYLDKKTSLKRITKKIKIKIKKDKKKKLMI